jgi:phosphoglycolate phosphatase
VLLVFDFDGTLVDSLHDLAEAASDLAEAYGGSRLSDAVVAGMIGDGAGILVERVMRHLGITPAPPEALPKLLEAYDRRMLDHTAPYPGLIDTLETLRSRHRLALLTNKPEAPSRRILNHCNLAGFFEAAVFGDGSLPRKPDPAGLAWLMAHCGCGPERTVMIGDSLVDVETARAAGVQLCLARYGFGFASVPAGAVDGHDWLIDRPEDLLKILGNPERL